MKKYLGQDGLKNVLGRLKEKLDEKASRPNLLDNSRWDKLAYIVNQRGVGGAISDAGYFIDRWKLVNGTVTVQEGGLVLNGTMVQILENDPGEPVTASVLTMDGLGTAEYSAENKTFTITAEGATLLAAKLEIGDGQTLAHKESGQWALNDPPPDYGTELAKCQRYQLSIDDLGYAFGMTNNLGAAFVSFPIPVTMRTLPTIKVTYPGILNVNGKMYNERLNFGFSFITKNSFTTMIAQDATTFEVNQTCVLYNADIFLDANL